MRDRQPLGGADGGSEMAVLERSSPRPNPRWRGVRSPPRADRQAAVPTETPPPSRADEAGQPALDRRVITPHDGAARR